MAVDALGNPIPDPLAVQPQGMNLPAVIPPPASAAPMDPSLAVQPPAIDNAALAAYAAANPDLVDNWNAGGVLHNLGGTLQDALAAQYMTYGADEIAHGLRNPLSVAIQPGDVGQKPLAPTPPTGEALAPAAAPVVSASPLSVTPSDITHPYPGQVTAPTVSTGPLDPSLAVQPGATSPTGPTQNVGGVQTQQPDLNDPLPPGLTDPTLHPADAKYGTPYYAVNTNSGDFAGAVMAGADQAIRLIDGKTGEVIYQGTGPEGARIAAATANAVSSNDGKKATWAIQGDTGGGNWVTQAEDLKDTKHSLLGTLADIALPILGAFLAPVTFGGSLVATLGAAGAGALGAAAGSGVSSLAQGRGLEDTLLHAGLSGLGAYVAPGINSALAKTFAPAVLDPATQAAITSGANIGANTGLGLGAQAALSGAAQGATDAGTQALAGGLSEVVVNGVRTLVPTALASTLGTGTGALAGGAISSNGGSNAVQGGQGQDTLGGGTDISGVTSTAAPRVLPGVIGSAGGALTSNLLPNPGHEDFIADELVAHPPSKPESPIVMPPFSDPGPLNTIDANFAVPPPTTLSTGPVIVPPFTDPGLLNGPPNVSPKNDPSLLDKLTTKLTDPSTLLGLGLLGGSALLGGGGGSGGGYSVPTGPNGPGSRGSLDPIFSAQLPPPSMAVRAPRPVDPNTDWKRYAIQGPEQSFFTNVPQANAGFAVQTPAQIKAQGIGDLNHDGIIDALDLAIFRKKFGVQGFVKGGRTDFAVKGPGDGRSDDIDAKLSDGEYVMDAETVSMLGNGSTGAGAKKLDQFRVNLRKHKGKSLARGRFSVAARDPQAYMGSA